MPGDADPATCIAAGPWCFAGREELFPDWENRFEFAPEPLANPARLANAAAGAQALCAKITPLIVEALWPGFWKGREKYWFFLLSPWAMEVARQLTDRNLRILAMREKWSDEALIVPVASSDESFAFLDERDFTMRGSLGTRFNFWLFSRLLMAKWPRRWIAENVESGVKEPEPPAPNFRDRARRLVRNFLLKAPFPKLKGVSFRRSLLFSRAISRAVPGPDKSLDPATAFADAEALRSLEFPEDILEYFLKTVPQSIKKIVPPRKIPRGVEEKIRAVSPLFYEDASYRHKLALWRLGGGRLACVQHGGNYGLVKTPCDRAFVEYSQDAFITWGWKKHGDARGDFIPLPYPQLASLAGKRRARDEKALFVGAEMATYGYRLESTPTPLQFVAYRRAKSSLLSALGNLASKILYRPYFNLPGLLEDGRWLLKRHSQIEICEGPLTPRLITCRLLILDHHGTVMLEALAANIPMILYWDRDAWPLTRRGEELLDVWENCGVWFPSPEKAAAKAREIWNDPDAWQNSEPVQKARRLWREYQALAPEGDLDAEWISALESL